MARRRLHRRHGPAPLRLPGLARTLPDVATTTSEHEGGRRTAADGAVRLGTPTTSRTWLFYVILGVLVAPIYVLGASLAVRADLFDFKSDTPLSADDARAVWGFLGAAIAATVSAIGLLITRSNDLRTFAFQQQVEENKNRQQRETDQRLTLDTAVQCLTLLGDDKYAPPARIAGALTSLVHLRHPIIALRCLAAMWPEGNAVDVKTAVWIMEQAFDKGVVAPSTRLYISLARILTLSCRRMRRPSSGFRTSWTRSGARMSPIP
jgi:hypothetical protein